MSYFENFSIGALALRDRHNILLRVLLHEQLVHTNTACYIEDGKCISEAALRDLL